MNLDLHDRLAPNAVEKLSAHLEERDAAVVGGSAPRSDS
jgi:hypothetical protein